MKDGNADLFLSEIETDIQKAKSEEYKRMLKVNKATGLIYSGSWDDAIELLDNIGDRFKYRVFSKLYYINYISALLYKSKVEEAVKLYEEKKVFLQDTESRLQRRDKRVIESIKRIEAIINFHRGNLPESQAAFEELLSSQKYDIHLAVTRYFLGLICLNEGDLQRGREHMELAKALGKKTFIGRIAAGYPKLHPIG